MEISLLGLIGTGLAAMFFGYFFGLFEGRGQGYKKRQREEPVGLQVGSALPPPVSPSTQLPRQDANLLELSRGDAGMPVLHLEGRNVDARNMTPETRKRLIELMVLLRPWVEPSAVSESTAVRTHAPESVSPSMAERPPLAAQKVEDQSIGTGARAKDTKETDATVSSPLSLVAQIDFILQARLVGTPLAARGIRLAEALNGGATVFVGTSQYDGVDKVPDPEVQAAIRAAISEWEKRSTPS